MRKRTLSLALAGVLLLVAASAYIAQGVRLYQGYHRAYANYQFVPAGRCDALVAWSPPSTIYTGLYVNQPTLVALRYRSPAPQSLRVSLGIPHFTEDQVLEVAAAPAFQTQAFKPPLLADALASFTSLDERAAQMHLKVQSDTNAVCDTTVPVRLRAREWMHWYDPATGDNSHYLVGWVTPHAPAVNTLIDRAAQLLAQNATHYPAVSQLAGYTQDGDAAQVRSQVNVLFDTLQSVYHVRYAEDNVPYSQDAAQHIQLPTTVLTASAPTAMCVETTALLASAAEHLGLHPYIVIVPGHAFLGVALGADASAPIEYWETSDLNGGISGSQANLHGNTEYAQQRARGTIERVIDVQYWRERGIQSIG